MMTMTRRRNVEKLWLPASVHLNPDDYIENDDDDGGGNNDDQLK